MSGTDLEQVAEKDLKRVRAGHLSYLKRKIDSFNDYVSSMDKPAADKSKLETSLQQCKDSFQDFVSSHNEYMESGIDAEEKTRVSTQYVEASDRFVQIEQVAYALLRPKTASILTHTTRTRSMASSKVSSLQARQRMAEADIKLQYLKRQQEVQRQADELQRQVEEAKRAAQRRAEELEAEQEVAIAKRLLQIAEQAEQGVDSSTDFELDSQRDIQDKAKPTSTSEHLPPPQPPLPSTVFAAPDMSAIKALAQAIKQGPSLPKIQLMKFSGDPAEYAEFHSNFKASVEIHVEDDNEKLMRLISQCTGKAADAIRSCVSLPQGTKYNAAWTTLKQNFGQPHMVSQAHIKRLKEITVRKYDAVSLLEFARRLEDAHRTLLSLGDDYANHLSNDDLIKQLQRKLPDESLKRQWVKKAGALLMTQTKILFKDFIAFVKYQGNLLNNSFAEDLSKPKMQTSKVMNLQVQEACQQCKGPHKLWKCDTFRSLNIKDRNQTVRSARLCRKCLRPNHFASDCRVDIRCKSCGRPHNTLLHFERSPSQTSINNFNDNLNDSSQKPTQQATPHGAFSAFAGSTSSWFKVVPVVVHGNRGPVLANAFLDNGSDTSLCTSSLLEKLDLKNCQTVRYSLSTLNGEQTTCGKSANLRISSIDRTTSLVLKCLSTDRLPIDEHNIACQADLRKYKHMQGVTLAELEGPADLLIGNDHADLIETQLDIRKGQAGEPIAVKTVFGWTVFGPNSRLKSSANVHFIKSEPDILSNLRQLYDHEFSDLIATSKKGLSPDDQQAHQIMQNSFTLIDGHYQIDLPFRTDPAQLKGNYYMAQQRLLNLKKRFARDPHLKDSYEQVIQRYETEGACSVAADQSKENRWFLPHHAVNSASKTRVVFDCAAQYRRQSLNDNLFKGPDNTNPMIEILMRFRAHPVAVIADIRSMFHQVRVPPENRNKLSFLWWQDGDLDKDPKVYEMNVHVFGATSSPSVCEFALRQTATDNKTSHSSEAVDSVLKDFYVDDWLRSFPTAEEAIEISHEVSDLVSKGGFHLTKWMSNNSDVLNSFSTEDTASDMRQIDLLESSHKALGLLWNLQDDTISNKLPAKDYPATKRGVLASVASVYDPLGIISPIVLRGKLLNQTLCLSKLEWDSPVPSDLHDLWLEWISDLESIDSHALPRCITPSFPILRTELHHFSDASQMAYGSVSYIRFIGTSGEVHCAFLFAKSKVKPSKPGITIPRLELTAAMNLIAINEMILNSFAGRISIDTVTYWTDSMIVLKYINNDSKSLNVFVSNRVAKIREASNVSQWKHIKGSKNPADTASRGLCAKEIQSWRDWIQGPDFLWHEPITYSSQEKIPSLDEDDEGVTKQQTVLSTCQKDEFWPSLFDRYSSWTKLLRLVAWLVRVKNRMESKSPLSSTSPDITDLNAAENLIIKAVQRDFSSSMKQLAKLNPFSEQEILRVGGRLHHSQLPRPAKHPAILPARHPVTKLLIKHYHESNGHSGAQHTLAALRQRYWIIKGCSAVRQITRQCHTCRRQNERPGDQIMAPLPAARVSTEGSEYPFAVTGIDYFGPLYVSKARVTRSQNTPLMKRYGCIFTCLKSRAVHLELAKDLSTEAFMNVLLRFISRRGPPLVLYSDNGTNFRGAVADVLDGLQRLHHESIKRNLNSKGIEWVFNPPSASHQGGVWERLVRSVKKVLGAQLRDRIVSEEVLQTYLCEVEKILNDRPLTRVSDDSNDLDVLTPNHLLLLHRNASTDFSQATNARATWRLACILANEFWLRWRKEYLSLLQERQKWLYKRRNFKCGDLVLLVNANAPRGVWMKGIVTEVFPGSDGCVREAIVRTSSGFLRRDIRKLCMLEENLLSTSA